MPSNEQEVEIFEKEGGGADDDEEIAVGGDEGCESRSASKKAGIVIRRSSGLTKMRGPFLPLLLLLPPPPPPPPPLTLPPAVVALRASKQGFTASAKPSGVTFTDTRRSPQQRVRYGTLHLRIAGQSDMPPEIAR